MKIIKAIWRWLRTDGLLHITCSALILLALCDVMPLWAAIVITVILGIGKEIYDRHHDGTAELHDLICDAIGIVLGVLIHVFR